MYCLLPVSVRPAVMGYKMIANQMAGLLGHPVSVLPASMAYKMRYHGSELICILSNDTSMFQVAQWVTMYKLSCATLPQKKAKKQFMLFQELVSFAKKAAAKKEILSKMAEKMEVSHIFVCLPENVS